MSTPVLQDWESLYPNLLEVSFLQSEPQKWYGCSKESQELLVQMVPEVELEVRRLRHGRSCAKFHSNTKGIRSGGAATDAGGMRIHAADMGHILVYHNPYKH